VDEDDTKATSPEGMREFGFPISRLPLAIAVEIGTREARRDDWLFEVGFHL
jgi:hypothetical protein